VSGEGNEAEKSSVGLKKVTKFVVNPSKSMWESPRGAATQKCEENVSECPNQKIRFPT